jgi:hypothetical protein
MLISISASPGGASPTPGRPLPLSRRTLPVPRARRNVDVQRAAVRQDNGLLAAIDGIKKREIEMITDILAPPAVASAARATEDLRENILRSAVDESESPSCWCRPTSHSDRKNPCNIADAAAPCLKRRFPRGQTAPACPIAQEIVGGRNSIELVFSSLVAGIKVRVQLFRQAVTGFLDFVASFFTPNVV